jgi:hypothetical protein
MGEASNEEYNDDKKGGVRHGLQTANIANIIKSGNNANKIKAATTGFSGLKNDVTIDI